MQPDKNTYKRTLWQSRRGMLELDLLLMPFCQEQYPVLSEQEQITYQQLMGYEDTQLYSWLMGFAKPDMPDLCDLVTKIRHYAQRSADTA